MQKDTETLLLKGNEAIAHAAIRYGYDGFFGYPITPQSEILETLALLRPWETTGMVVLQAESELASINMLYGAGCTGKLVFTSSSSPGIALMQEGLSYMAGNELPGVIVSVGRGGPGLGTIQPGQADYYQAVYGGGNGDYNTIVLAYPNYWGTMPMAVFTFLEHFDFTGKTILPLCTNEGSGMGSSENDIRKTSPGADVKKGLPITGSEAANAKADVERWLSANGLM
jgi:pyruvate/2-oxoacid:ferredoxin oxidoreductase alpha subunit